MRLDESLATELFDSRGVGDLVSRIAPIDGAARGLRLRRSGAPFFCATSMDRCGVRRVRSPTGSGGSLRIDARADAMTSLLSSPAHEHS